jgi:hypothetical protein
VWVELSPSHVLDAVPLPANAASFKAACDAIGAVRKAKTAAGLSLAAPVEQTMISGDFKELEMLSPVQDDIRLAAGSRAVQLAKGPAGSDNRYSAIIVPTPAT